jgi:hypothetical protein
MADIPMALMTVIGALAPLFSKRIFVDVKLWLAGAILAPGKRPVTAVLHVMGKGAEAHFQNYHRGSTGPAGRPSRPVACCWGCRWTPSSRRALW